MLRLKILNAGGSDFTGFSTTAVQSGQPSSSAPFISVWYFITWSKLRMTHGPPPFLSSSLRSSLSHPGNIQMSAMRWGLSRLALNLSRNCAANWSSIRRPSLDIVTVMSCCCRSAGLPSEFRQGESSGRERPTARMQACGGLITALKPLIPNIPRLEMLREEETWRILVYITWIQQPSFRGCPVMFLKNK